MLSQVAVVIPFRGELGHLAEAVNSVRKSSFRDFRILVFDDNKPPHGGLDFLDDNEYFPTGGIGLPAVIEYSKSLISEEYVALLAGDDLMTTSRLHLQITAIRRENSEICLSRMRKFSSKYSKGKKYARRASNIPARGNISPVPKISEKSCSWCGVILGYRN
jgi:hypothetical protein